MKTAKEISSLLAENMHSLCAYLLPAGKLSGSEWTVGSLRGEAGESLKIRCTGEKTGVWCDFARGEKGDALDLWAQVRGLSLPKAMHEAANYLGLALPNFLPVKKNGKRLVDRAFNLDEGGDVFNYLTRERCLSMAVLNKFKIGAEGNNILFPFYRDDELLMIKKLSLHRSDNKKIISLTEKDCEYCLFGWQAINPLARVIVICEGEIDAMTLWDYGYDALSVPMGVNNDKWIENDFDLLAVYDEIYLCMDNDEPGKKCAQQIAERLGLHRCRVVILPYKDANACRQNNISREEFSKCFSQATSLDPRELVKAGRLHSDMLKAFQGLISSPGLNAPWQKTHGLIAFRDSELSIWSGINGHGKTQYVCQLMLHAIYVGKKVCIASLEINAGRLLMRMARQATGLAKPTEEYLEAVTRWWGENLFIFNFVGQASRYRLLDIFEYARLKYAVDFFVIDSMMQLDIAEEDYKVQKEFINALCAFKEKYKCHIMLVAHPRKGMNEKIPSRKLDIKGSGVITDLADSCFSVWRNKEKEEEVENAFLDKVPLAQEIIGKPDCIVFCDKQRFGEWEGKFSFWFDKNSLQYLSSPDSKPRSYVEFSKPIER